MTNPLALIGRLATYAFLALAAFVFNIGVIAFTINAVGGN